MSDLTADDRAHLDYDLAKERFDLVVPNGYRPENPHGLFVWLGVTEAPAEWFAVLARRRLIFVAPLRCEGRSPFIKKGLAIDAVHNLTQRYNVDPDRVYLAGFSAGAHQAGGLLPNFPDVFRGALCLMGGHLYVAGGRSRDAPTGREPTILGPRWYGEVEKLKASVKFVAVFGADDTVCHVEQGRIDYACLTLDGFCRVSYIELPHWGHNHPDVATFDRALVALEAPAKKPPTTAPLRGNQRPLPSQLAQAQRLLFTAKLIIDMCTRVPAPIRAAEESDNPMYDLPLARRCVEQLQADYPGTPAAVEARKLLPALDAVAPTTAPAGAQW